MADRPSEADDQLPITVTATPHELLLVATGHELTVGTIDGGTVVLRLPTLLEYRESLARTATWFEANGLRMPDPPTDQEINALIRPFPGGGRG